MSVVLCALNHSTPCRVLSGPGCQLIQACVKIDDNPTTDAGGIIRFRPPTHLPPGSDWPVSVALKVSPRYRRHRRASEGSSIPTVPVLERTEHPAMVDLGVQDQQQQQDEQPGDHHVGEEVATDGNARKRHGERHQYG